MKKKSTSIKQMYQFMAGCMLFCALFMNFSSALAQGSTSSGIKGYVFDNSNNPMEGATVVAIHLPTNAKFQTRVSDKGSFNLQNLPVGGPYTIEISHVGVQKYTEDRVTLPLGQVYSMKVFLNGENQQLNTVEVKTSKNAGRNLTKTGASKNISRNDIDNYPSLNRSLSDYTRFTPQSSGLSFGGRNNRYNNIQIDGSQNNDIMGYGVGGGTTTGAPGGQAGTQPISLDAIDEIQVVLAPFDVKQGSFTGAGINAVTRRGNNATTGSVYTYGKNQSLVGKSPDANRNKYNNFSDYQYGFRLGGPIVKNKLFYFVNAEISRRNEPLLYMANRGTGSSSESLISADIANQVANVLRNTYNYEPGILKASLRIPIVKNSLPGSII
ncbi:hypothetical protein DU508_13235 [Pedobacter chinensis]|uniref:TonB-dependent transporter Oar-like beta-barrel domain-containing protein n=1 Tax=Pedobacter chinensis TaxID=2282421 RepID=A0A369PV65_9SPHI|nr:carboxypeptidase-like regulatory domain-containing protein [Pedobacter chinensis]RDC56541.1 hypothetical protein DU508_13235 [Pedobacter chinensis]